MNILFDTMLLCDWWHLLFDDDSRLIFFLLSSCAHLAIGRVVPDIRYAMQWTACSTVKSWISLVDYITEALPPGCVLIFWRLAFLLCEQIFLFPQVVVVVVVIVVVVVEDVWLSISIVAAKFEFWVALLFEQEVFATVGAIMLLLLKPALLWLFALCFGTDAGPMVCALGCTENYRFYLEW